MGEGVNVNLVDPVGGDGALELPRGAEQRWSVVWVQEVEHVGRKGQAFRTAAAGLCGVDSRLKNSLMTAVHPIKLTQSQYDRGGWVYAIDGVAHVLEI